MSDAADRTEGERAETWNAANEIGNDWELQFLEMRNAFDE